ncbi:MAG: PilN domain-containing protein [Nitrospirota bacterium]
MSSLNLDLRDGSLRILFAKDDTVKYSGFVKDFPVKDEKSAAERLSSEIKNARWKRGRVNVILPTDIISHKSYQIPPMDIEDAKKVVRREISRELKAQKFAFGIRRLAKQEKTGAGMQNILAEYAVADDVIKYLSMLKKCGIRPDAMTSGIEGNVQLFQKFRTETDGNEAVLDIGLSSIDIAVFNNGKLVDYDRIQTPYTHDDRRQIQDAGPEQTDKMKIYRVIDALYNFTMAYGKNNPEEKFSMLWICGIGSTAEGITDSISDGLGLNCRLLNPFDAAIENGSAYSALSGVSALSGTEQFLNLIPGDVLEGRAKLLRQGILAASLVFYMILLTGGYTILNRTEKDLRIIYDRITFEQALHLGKENSAGIYSSSYGTLSKIVSGSTGLYSVLRDIASLTPPGVTLNSIKFERRQETNNLKINATIQYNDENFRDAVLTGLLDSLDNSPNLKRTSIPEISTTEIPGEKRKEISFSVEYEVTR